LIPIAAERTKWKQKKRASGDASGHAKTPSNSLNGTEDHSNSLHTTSSEAVVAFASAVRRVKMYRNRSARTKHKVSAADQEQPNPAEEKLLDD
jgi:hypothetical protein